MPDSSQMVREVGHAAVPSFNKRVSRPEGMTWEAFQRELVQMRLTAKIAQVESCLLYTSPSPRDRQKSRMPSSA